MTSVTFTRAQLRSSRFRRLILRNKLAAFGIVVLLLLLLSCLLAPWLTSDPLAQDLSNVLRGPSFGHPFGTDHLGRDLLSRVLNAGRISLSILALVLSISFVFGVGIGLIAGFIGGWVDEAIMRVVDLFLAMPTLIIASALVGVLGPGVQSLSIALSVTLWPQYSRLVRSQVLSIRETEMVVAARALGGGDSHIARRHVLPGLLGPVAVQLSLDAGGVMLLIATLSFLGMGVQPPTPEWGQMLVDARAYMQISPHLVIVPGLAILAAVYGFNALSDLLEDWLNPRSG